VAASRKKDRQRGTDQRHRRRPLFQIPRGLAANGKKSLLLAGDLRDDVANVIHDGLAGAGQYKGGNLVAFAAVVELDRLVQKIEAFAQQRLQVGDALFSCRGLPIVSCFTNATSSPMRVLASW